MSHIQILTIFVGLSYNYSKKYLNIFYEFMKSFCCRHYGRMMVIARSIPLLGNDYLFIYIDVLATENCQKGLAYKCNVEMYVTSKNRLDRLHKIYIFAKDH